MIHRVDIELNIEDTQVIKKAEEQATQELVKALKNEVFDHRYSWSKDSTILSEKGKEIIKEWLDENKEQLYDLVAQKVATSMLRSQKFRDILEDKIDVNG